MIMFSTEVISFYKTLHLNTPLPKDVEVMNPYQDEDAFSITKKFYKKFYNDNNLRTMLIGINPGRFGGGITGVPFTDPGKLEINCGIANPFMKKPELSADFVYKVVESFGGANKFFSQFYITAMSPLGFTKENKNLNYYDIPQLKTAVEPFIIRCLSTQTKFPINKKKVFCLGEGENYKYLAKLNERHLFFNDIVPLPHPRFIMQYRRKSLNEYVERYKIALTS